ncbi:MAG: PAS domain S-box protein [Desulfatiglandales bacterium]
MEGEERIYQAFLEDIEEGVYETDLQGNFTYVNKAFARLLGYPAEEVVGKNFSIFLSQESSKEAFEVFNRLFRTKGPIKDILWRVKTLSGREGLVELSAHAILTEKGDVKGFRGVARDVTDKLMTQALLRRSQIRYKTLLDFVPYPLVVFDNKGKVSYLNSAFTQVFGWTLEELVGKNIPYVPSFLEEETRRLLQRFIEEKTIPRYETQRLTKDGRILDVIIRAAIVSEEEDPESFYELVILRDITQQKRIEKNNEALFKLSLALPRYPRLDDLLNYISGEIKRLLEVEAAMVILLDEEKNELYFKTAAHDDIATQRRMREVRFPAGKGISSWVISKGESTIVEDVYKDPRFYSHVDEQMGLTTRNMLQVPLVGKEKIIGTLCAINKQRGKFDETDVEFLSMIASTVNLSIENATYAQKLKEALEELTGLNKAKDKVINHLSHELRTPLAILGASLKLLKRHLPEASSQKWYPAYERAERNLERLLEMQYQLEDIMRDVNYEVKSSTEKILELSRDLLLGMVEEECIDSQLPKKVQEKIDEFFRVKEWEPKRLLIDQVVDQIYRRILPQFSHRKVRIELKLSPVPHVYLPEEVVEKVFVAIFKNAVENTPDNSKIEVSVHGTGKAVILRVQDFGVGITKENQARLFEGFFHAKDTMLYSSKRPYDFYAGGKGVDLLRAKIFSERYNFKISMSSERCPFIPTDSDLCVGDASKCSFIKEEAECLQNGGTLFEVIFPLNGE